MGVRLGDRQLFDFDALRCAREVESVHIDSLTGEAHLREVRRRNNATILHQLREIETQIDAWAIPLDEELDRDELQRAIQAYQRLRAIERDEWVEPATRDEATRLYQRMRKEVMGV